jgi:flagellar protein FlaI
MASDEADRAREGDASPVPAEEATDDPAVNPDPPPADDELTDRDTGDDGGNGDGRGAGTPDPGGQPGGEPASRVAVGEYTWEDLKREYYYDEEGQPPTDSDGNVVPFDPAEYLGFDPDLLPGRIGAAGERSDAAADLEEERTLTTLGDLTPETAAQVDVEFEDVAAIENDDVFFTRDGETTIANRYDLEKAVPVAKKRHFLEIDRYWVNEPYAFVSLFHSTKENEKKYYLIEPYRNEIEENLAEFLTEKLRSAIKYSDDDVGVEESQAERRDVIERETRKLLARYDIYEESTGVTDSLSVPLLSGEGDTDDDTALRETVSERVGGALPDRVEGALPDTDLPSLPGGSGSESGSESNSESESASDPEDAGGLSLPSTSDLPELPGSSSSSESESDSFSALPELPELPVSLPSLPSVGGLLGGASEEQIRGIAARPEPAVLEEDANTLTEYQVEKLLYVLKRDFVGYERIDGIKHDINVEDISCDGYDSPVFVYHSDHEQLITNVFHGRDSLDDFVVKLAQRSGKGISKRQPQVDATLPDGSRAQLTLGREVSDHGTNYTIRQFKDVPFTPVDLINWRTFSLEEMAFLWLAIENNKSLIFAGGTASGKTTSLNAVSLFIPSNTKIVSIEDTREVELPQRNWIASVTRPSFSEDEKGDVDEFDLLESALRQRPDYIVMGEIRGEEGRTLFQVMSTGHTTYTTFHADSVGEVLKRFTTDPINVSKTLFTALDLVSIQTQTRVQGDKVRRSRAITEINEYNAEHDEINVQDVFEWQPERDEFQRQPGSSTLDEIRFDRGWDQDQLDRELFIRKAILAYLIDHGLNDYAEVAATVQAFINDPETILALVANDDLAASLEDLRGMESVLIDVDPEKEEMVPRPKPGDRVQTEVADVLAEAEDIFGEYRGQNRDLAAALAAGNAAEEDVTAVPSGEEEPLDLPASGDGGRPVEGPGAGDTGEGEQ